MALSDSLAPAPPRPALALALAREAGILLELAKWRLSLLVVATAVAGALVATPGSIDWLPLWWVALGAFLCAGGANGLNQLLERRRDALMERTRERPLPSARISPARALASAGVAVIAGVAALYFGAHPLAAALGLANVAIYVLLYTPLKVVTPVNTLIGAVCGAIPPLMGWAGALGRLDPGALALGAILFIWQIPHALSLAHLYREDYARGGFRMLPVIERGGALTFHVINLYCLALIPIPLAFPLLGFAGWRFALGSTLLGGLFAALGFMLWRRRDGEHARRVFLASIVYLPLLLVLLVIDHRLLGA